MQEKPVPLIKIILFLIVSGMAPVIVGPWMYFQTDEPLYWVFPLIGAGGIVVSVYRLKQRRKYNEYRNHLNGKDS